MEEALRAKLLSITALTAIVGTRINWGVRTQGAPLPSAQLHLIDERPQINLASPGEWFNGRVQVDCMAETHKVAKDAAQIIAAPASAGGLHCFRGTLGNIRFRIFVIDRASDRDTDGKGIVHRTRLDLNVWTAPIQGD